MQKSLFDETQNPETDGTAEKRKGKIGQGCRHQILEYFVDDETAYSMRRWVSDAPIEANPANMFKVGYSMRSTFLGL
jgi:hypothetical protein